MAEAEEMAATYGRIIGILMAQRDSQANGSGVSGIRERILSRSGNAEARFDEFGTQTVGVVGP